MPELRHLYFPTIFGTPRFDLKIKTSLAFLLPNDSGKQDHLNIDVLNVGTIPSYLNANAIRFLFIIKGKQVGSTLYLGSGSLSSLNPTSTIRLEPGRKQSYFFPLTCFADVKMQLEKWHETKERAFPTEVQVRDEIDNMYQEILDEGFRSEILKYTYK